MVQLKKKRSWFNVRFLTMKNTESLSPLFSLKSSPKLRIESQGNEV